MSEMPKEIAAAIVQVMGKIKALAKTGKNTFHNYKFATIGDLMAELQPALAEAGLVVFQTQESSDIIDGNTLAVRYRFTLAHSSGAYWADGVAHTGMAGMKNSKGGIDDKSYNKCHTAARKYFLLGLFQIPVLEEGDERLSDGDTDRQEDQPEQSTRKVQRQQVDTIRNALAAIEPDDLEAAVAVWTQNTETLVKLPAVTKEWFIKLFRDRFKEAPPALK